MGFKTIKKSSAPDLVASQILKQIEDNTLAPGSRLPSQRDLATLLGVGRSSIREAINALVVMGYLEPVQGRGTFVSEKLPGSDPGVSDLVTAFKAGSIMDLMEARIMLECKSASLAALRASTAQINKIRKSLARISMEEGDYDTFLSQDLAFHHTVAEATRNAVICEMTKLVLDKLALHHAGLKTDRLSPEYLKTSVDTALGVLKAVENGDPDAASEWMGKHLAAIRVELSQVL